MSLMAELMKIYKEYSVNLAGKIMCRLSASELVHLFVTLITFLDIWLGSFSFIYKMIYISMFEIPTYVWCFHASLIKSLLF